MSLFNSQLSTLNSPLIPPGCKQTEVGVIPEEWEVKTLGSLTSLLTNGFVGTATTAYVEGDDGVLYIQGYNVQENGFNFHGIKRVSKAFHARNKKSCLQTGDLLTIQTGDIGVTTVVLLELAGANCHALIISRLRKQESEAGYYGQYFNSERGRVAFKEIETGTTMKHLNGGDMKRLFLPSPPVEQQRAIATALSDVNGLLGGLERLIAKKRDLKQATMQQLLTGQTRLPGFHGEWKVKRLGEGIALHSGHHVLAQHCNTQSEGVPYLTGPADFPEGRIQHTKFTTRPSTICSPGDILVTVKGSGSGTIVLADAAYCISRQLMAIRVSGWDVRFIHYSLLQNAAQFRAASTGLIPGLSRSDILDQPLPLPPTVPEQTAIAEVLSDMDGELAGLEQRREKTRALKQAMMQELLTGRVRLIENG